MKRTVAVAFACVSMALFSGVAAAQQKGPENRQRPAAPMPSGNEHYYRTFTADQLARADQAEPVQRAGRGAPAAVPNTANVVEEIFRRGLGPIVLGVPGQRNADGTEKPSFVLTSQKAVFNALNPAARKDGAGSATGVEGGRKMSPKPKAERDRLKRNLVALKVNMTICGNGITVNDPGWRFADLWLAPDFSAARFPIYGSCEECNAVCPGPCFMTVELNCRCYLEHLPMDRAAAPSPPAMDGPAMPRRLRDLAAFADNMLTNWEGVSEADLDAVNQTIEIVNAAFASEQPFGPQDIVEWGGADGKLVLSSTRPLSEVSFLTGGR